MDGGDVSDVSHVSDSLSASSGGSESYISDLSDNAADEICRNLPPYYDIMEFNDPWTRSNEHLQHNMEWICNPPR